MHVLALLALLDSRCDLAEMKIGHQTFSLEVANTEEEREQGLMHVMTLKPYDGMVFAYETPRHVYFWMKDTPLPLDMLFFDAAGAKLGVHENAKPFDLTPIDGGPNVQYVIELPVGEAKAFAAAGQDDVQLLSCKSDS